MVLENCINLSGCTHQSEFIKKLKFLSLKGCKNLETLFIKFEMESLEIFIFSICSKVKKNSRVWEKQGMCIKTFIGWHCQANLKWNLLIYIYIYIFFFFFSICSKVKGIQEFGENKECVSKLLLDYTTITKLPISIAYFTCLASLNLRDCEHLMSLPRIFYM